jgi:hypothetical protein
LADKILKKIPGPHQAVMDKWPKWSQKNSPPIPGGLYPNPKWKPQPQLTKPKVQDIPKAGVPKVEASAIRPAPGSESPEGPTLLEQPFTNPPEEGRTLPIPQSKAPKYLKPNAAALRVPALEETQAYEIAMSDDGVSTISEESSLDLNAAMAAVKGMRPDPVVIEGTAGAMYTPEAIAKHFATMGGNSPLFCGIET